MHDDPDSQIEVTPLNPHETGSNTASAEPLLLEQVRSRLRLKHYSLRYGDAYCYRIRRFIYSTGKPHQLTVGGVGVELATETRRPDAAAERQSGS